jgi:hypothetical protein
MIYAKDDKQWNSYAGCRSMGSRRKPNSGGEKRRRLTRYSTEAAVEVRDPQTFTQPAMEARV